MRYVDSKILTGESTNLARFPSDFHFFFGVAILLKGIDVRNNIKWKRMSEDFILGNISNKI